MKHDLIIKGGIVIDFPERIDGVYDVAFAGGKVSAVGDDISDN